MSWLAFILLYLLACIFTFVFSQSDGENSWDSSGEEMYDGKPKVCILYLLSPGLSIFKHMYSTCVTLNG